MTEIKSFLDENGLLTAFPAKNKKKLYALWYLAKQFEPGKMYTESQVNDLLDKWHTFHDPATLRRELYNKHLINRTNDCKTYWLEENGLSLQEFFAKHI